MSEKKSASANKTGTASKDEKSIESGKTEQVRKRTFKEQKEFDELENQIFEAEERKEELEGFLSGGESNHEKLAEYGKEYASLQENLEKMYSRWEELGVLRPM